ncbi:MAG: SDR family oxidoreductase [Chloroflexi bacterium]|nr:MAG: SDR family oxidoreductase [Chloroflexota bacterium]
MTGQVAVVTGAVGGIGSVICKRLAEAGASVVLLDLQDLEKIAGAADALPGDNHLPISASITDSNALKGVAEKIAARYGTIDLLVNNAGITRPVPHNDLDGLDDELIDAIFQVNWRGGFACIRAFKDLLANQNGGVVVNISSIAGQTGIGSNVAYCASKAAINAMTISLGRALAPKIRVVAVAPGWVMGEYAKRMPPEYLQDQIDKTPLGRLTTPEDVAETIIGIKTMLPFSTSCVIPVDGGRPFI